MSLKGGQNGVKNGGAHGSTHENSSGAEGIENSSLLDSQFLSKSINNSTTVTSICLQNGGEEETAEESLALLSSDSEDLESYERSVIENNAEWLKSRCRSLEGVDFDIPTNSHEDILDLEVKEKDMGGELFEEVENMSADDGDDRTVISICGETGVLSTSELSISSGGIIQISPSKKHVHGKQVVNLVSNCNKIHKNSESDNELESQQSTILLSTEDMESLHGQGFVFDTLNVGSLITPSSSVKQVAVKSSNSANSTVILNSSESLSDGTSEEKTIESEIRKKVDILNTTQTVIPSNTGTYIVAQPEQSDRDNSAQPNLTLATISISTDKVANSTQILVNTNQGQQLYLINTADLTQATNALQPLAQSQEATAAISSPVGPVITPTPSAMMSVSPLQVQGTGYLILPVDSESNGMILSVSASHADRSANKKVWVCPEDGCSKIFRKLSKLKIHQMRHTGERPFKCSKNGCDWAFTTAYKLKRHEEAHGGRKDYNCDFEGCGRKFTTIYNLNSHKKLHERPYTEICPKQSCRQQFTTKRQLDLHMRTHSGVEKNYKCPHEGCNKVFFSKNCMGSHARVHLIERDDLQCKFDGCGKVFDKLCRLKQHTRQHTGEKPYVCLAEGCNWAFATASKLKRHSAKHTGLRKWTCSICLKGFMRAEHLKGHMITHSGDKPFSCPVENCLAKFTAKGSLYVHLKKHETMDNKITYHCPIDGCLSHYANKSCLRSHIIKHYLNAPEGTEMSHLDLVPLLTGEDLSDSPLDNLISSSNDTPTPNSISVSIPQLLTDTNTTSLINTADFINTDSVMLTGESTPEYSPPSVGGSQQTTGKTLKTPKLKTPNSTELTSVISRVALENSSGSARTDYRSNHLISDRARKRWRSLKGVLEAPKLDNIEESCEKINSLVLPTLNAEFTSTDMCNSQGLMFRDPETGITYVQTQLLQDDPPHPDIYSENLMDANDNIALHDNAASTNMGTKSDFTGTTINLQDLE